MTQTFNVTSLTELTTALSNASGGDVILLAGGNYGNADLTDSAQMDLTFAATVTIKSADAGDPAVFTGMDMRNATNVAIEGVVFDYTFAPGDAIYKQQFIFTGCEGLTLRGNRFDGDDAQGVSAVDDGFGFGYGLVVRNSSDVVITDNELQGFWTAATVYSSSNVTFTGNNIHDIRSDGLDVAAVTGIRIEDNNMHDFRGSLASGDHRDMIQFWTTGTMTPNSNIIIRGNTLDIGNGDWTQSIFMRNEMVDTGQAGTEMFYRNVLIEDNVIVNGHTHGILVGEAIGVIIRNNTVLHADGVAVDGEDSSVEVPRITVAVTSTGVVITNNLTAAINGYSGQSGWTVQDNAFAQDQDPLASDYYADLFISSTLQAVNGQHGFILLPGSVADQLGAGATATGAGQIDGVLAARFHITSVQGDGATHIFDASFSDLGGLPPGTTVSWLFGDGTTATGLKVAHAYTGGGMEDIVLALRLPDGTTVAATMQLAVEGPDVVALTAAGGFEAYAAGQAVFLGKPAAGSTDGLQLGGPTTVASVPLVVLRDLAATDEVSIDLSLKADTAGASGEVFLLHGSFSATVTATGELSFSASSRAGVTQSITTSGAGLADLDSHDISIQLANGQIRITVDGQVMGQGAFDGLFAWNGFQDLKFGNPWGAKNFDGDLTAFRIRTDASDYPTTPHTEVLQDSGDLVLTGGVGNDVYRITTNHVRIEDAGGTDEVGSATLSIDLAAAKFDNVENIRQIGTADINLSGDEGGNLLVGNAGENVVTGRDGNDTLVGGGGADTLIGGGGSDTYIVQSADDQVTETGGGYDTVATAISYTLGSGIEQGILTGTAYRLTGNAGDNLLMGNDATNLLIGGGGADTMAGGGGNDTYILNGASDRVTEAAGSGYDTVLSAVSFTLGANIEKGDLIGRGYSLTGNAGDNLLMGNAGANLMIGGRARQ
jgi:hypothetical protein